MFSRILTLSLTLAMAVSFLPAQQGGRGGGAAAGAPARIPPSKSAPPACRRSTATSRSIGTSAPAASSSKSRGSTPTSSTPPASPPDSAPTTSASTADRRAAARSSPSSASGPRVLLVQGNESFRSSSANPAERASVEDSFAKSVLWGFTVAAESNGRVLVDATDFFLRDGHGAGRRARPGAYRVDRTRSAVYMPRTKGFPKNTEIEVTLTFTNEAAGGRGGGVGGPAQGPPPS